MQLQSWASDESVTATVYKIVQSESDELTAADHLRVLVILRQKVFFIGKKN